jgi:transglutaminase-like putative cysteine protease
MHASSSLNEFLQACPIIDWQHAEVTALARRLAEGGGDDAAIAQRCFEFVRDRIKHSWDYRLNPVTCSASEVLRHGTGYCYAKSHLLAALLRANAIPAGLCYQRLSLHDSGAPYCLHGLNAVYLQQHGWYRIDARGNKPGVQAGFAPPQEQLAFATDGVDQIDLPAIYARPVPQVIRLLRDYADIETVYRHLADYGACADFTL